jgi:hypothetical protein
MPNPQNLKNFSKGYDPRRKGNGRKPYVHLRDAIAESIKVGDVVEVLNKILIEKEDIRAIQELCKIMGWYAPAEQKITTDDHIVLRFTDAEIPGHTAARGAEGSADEPQAV